MEFCIAFAIWLLILLIAGFTIYRVWAQVLGPSFTDILLLPGTLLAEITYSIACLVCGRPAAAGLISDSRDYRAPMQVPTGKYGFYVSMFAALLTISVMLVAYGKTTQQFGKPVIMKATLQSPADYCQQTGAMLNIAPGSLPDKFPRSLADLKDLGIFQIALMKRIAKAWFSQSWKNWRTWVYFYLSVSFLLRLTMVRHDGRATFAVNLAIALIIILGQRITGSFAGKLMCEPYALLTFMWGMMLYLILFTGVIIIFGRITKMLNAGSLG